MQPVPFLGFIRDNPLLSAILFMPRFPVLLGALIALLTLGAPDTVQAQGKVKVTYPKGAPRIASEYRSMKGVNGPRRAAPHQGIDIKGRNGLPILAVAAGKVLEVETGPCWGPTIVVHHGNGSDGKPLIALYGHLGRTDVTAGQTVARGQVIGALGNSYRQFKCSVGVRHLHLQLGRAWRGPNKGTYWGHVRYLKDGANGTNPHLYWADGRGQVTCFDPARRYPAGTLTYPVPCR